MDTNNLNEKTNSELSYILEYCSDADIRNSAWKVLAEKNPTNSELSYILEYCSDADIRNSAGKVLAEKNPTNSELSYILRWCSDADIRNSAGKVLAENVGIKVPVDEKELIKKIAIAVVSRPGSLKMDSWHCGTSHCLAGHACIENEEAMRIEKEHSTRIAGSAVLPNYAHLFYSDDDTVLRILTEIANQE